MVKVKQKGSKSTQNKSAIWNFLTGVVFLALIVTVGYFVFVYNFPYSTLNPFPPPTTEPIADLPSETPVPTPTITIENTATGTPTATIETQIQSTNTPIPTKVTATAQPTSTPTLTYSPTPSTDIIAITPLPEGTNPSELFFTPTATLRISYLYQFALQTDPYFVAASSTDPNKGCDWSGVGGKVFDIKRHPATGINVQMGGSKDDHIIPTQTTLTGTALQHGPAGYEFKIADVMFDSYQKLWVQLVDQTGVALSAKIYFNTYKDCTKNLVNIDFQQVR